MHIVELYNSGLSLRQIKAKTKNNYSHETIRKILIDNGVNLRKQKPGRYRKDQAFVDKIVGEWQAGTKPKIIAQNTKIPLQIIYYYIRQSKNGIR